MHKPSASRDRTWVELFQAGYSRRDIAKAFFVSMATVDRVVRKYVLPGGRKG